MLRRMAMLAALLLGMTGPVEAGREPVLKQVDLPHSYYWRELYLPELTTGPSSVSFTPDGSALVYSMGGSLWRQAIGSDGAAFRQREIGAVVLADVTSRGAVGQVDLEFHALGYEDNFARFSVNRSTFGKDADHILLRHQQQLAVSVVKILSIH